MCALPERFATLPCKVCRWAFKSPRATSGGAPQVVTKGPPHTMPTSSCHLSFPKNARLSQRLAGLSQRLAVRRAFGSQKAEKRLEISRNFSRQRYASDFRHTAKLSDNALMAS